jgi:UDPglucose--hexose-1-phosphate uridylyltransferase
MPQLREDRFTREWVFVATESVPEPQDLVAHRAPKRLPAFDPECPICPGNEHRTSPEVLRVPSAGQCGWAVRVVPNRFNVLSISGGPAGSSDDAPDAEGELGIREVVVETPDHSLSTALLPEAQLTRVWRASKIRYDELSLDPRVGHVTIAKNHGVEAGAALEHSHSQLIANQAIPPALSNWLEEARRHYSKCGECIFCQVLQEELDAQARIVITTEHFVALEPFASPSPFCTHIYPRRHMANFGETSGDEISDLARILRAVLVRIHFGLDNPDFSYTIRTAPVANAGVKYYHWHMSIVPHLPLALGVESAARVLMNPVLPETAAEYLRSTRVDKAIPA